MKITDIDIIILDIIILKDWRKNSMYEKIREHRGKCESWQKWIQQKEAPLCLKCFGGGIQQYTHNLQRYIQKLLNESGEVNLKR